MAYKNRLPTYKSWKLVPNGELSPARCVYDHHTSYPVEIFLACGAHPVDRFTILWIKSLVLAFISTGASSAYLTIRTYYASATPLKGCDIYLSVFAKRLAFIAPLFREASIRTTLTNTMEFIPEGISRTSHTAFEVRHVQAQTWFGTCNVRGG